MFFEFKDSDARRFGINIDSMNDREGIKERNENVVFDQGRGVFKVYTYDWKEADKAAGLDKVNRNDGNQNNRQGSS